MKRQRSRNRGGSGGGGGGGGGNKPTHNVNRAFDSNGPDNVKIRGHSQHVFEKYQQLARDAASAGDRVLAENYLQHAEHYFRLIRAVQPQRPASDIIGRDAFTSGIDIDFEDEGGGDGEPYVAETSEDRGQNGDQQQGDQRQDQRFDNRDQQRGQGGDQQRGQGDRNQGGDQQRGDRRPEYRRDEYRGDRDGRQDGNRQDTRSDGRQDGRQDAPRQDRQDSPRQDAPRQDGGRDRSEGRRDDRGYRNENRREDRPYRGDRAQESGSDPLAVVEPEATPLTQDRTEEGSPTLRSQDGGFSPAPAFLQSRAEAPAADAGEAAPKPRARRRAPRADAPPATEPSTEEA